MKISYSTIVGFFYLIGMISVLIRGCLVYELGMASYITIIGQIISAVQIAIIIILISIYKKNEKDKQPRDIISLRRALLMFWGIQVFLGLINSYTMSTSSIYFNIMILMLLIVNYNYSFLKKLIDLTFYTFLSICLFSLIFMNFGYGIQVDGEYNIVSQIGVRLYGFTQHANTLGSISALVCMYSYYNKKRLSFFIGVITLWYTQSKTNIAVLLIFIIVHIFRKLMKYINRSQVRHLYSIFISSGIFLTFTTTYYLIISKFEFTGRLGNWIDLLSRWMTNLKTFIIGCDSSMLYPYIYAENMYIDMAMRYGVIGILIFIYLIFTILSITWRNMKSGYNLSFALSIFIIFRSVTESIFINSNMGFGDFFNLVFLIIIKETYLRFDYKRDKNNTVKEEPN